MNSVTLQTTDQEERIASKINPHTMNSLTISEHAGGLSFANVDQVMEMAKLMSVSQVAVPKHLRCNPGACIAICIQAIEWRMSPFAVANRSYSVNDRMAYEAQLINAVILQRAPIKGRLKVDYTGQGGKRQCRIWATLKDNDEIVEYLSPEFDKIQPKNSPLWKTDPDQQHFYNASRAFCRRHFPDVLLGVYAKDEIEDSNPIGPDKAKDVTPSRNLNDRLDKLASLGKPAEQARQEPDHDPETGEITDVVETEAAAETSATKSETAEELSTEGDPETNDNDLPDEETLLDKGRAAATNGLKAFRVWKGKLTQAEFEEVSSQLASLEKAAKAADGVAA